MSVEKIYIKHFTAFLAELDEERDKFQKEIAELKYIVFIQDARARILAEEVVKTRALLAKNHYTDVSKEEVDNLLTEAWADAIADAIY